MYSLFVNKIVSLGLHNFYIGKPDWFQPFVQLFICQLAYQHFACLFVKNFRKNQWLKGTSHDSIFQFSLFSIFDDIFAV